MPCHDIGEFLFFFFFFFVFPFFVFFSVFFARRRTIPRLDLLDTDTMIDGKPID